MMSSRKQRISGILACVLACGVGPEASAQSLSDALRRGNLAFEQGRYDEALHAYDEVPETADKPLPVEVLNNRAAALFKLGKLADAREAWVRAAGMRDAEFEGTCRFNIGNTHYAEALASVSGEKPDPQAAKVGLDKAIEQYRDALRLNPQLASARANLELAAQLKTRLDEMQKSQDSQPTSQPSQNQQQEQNQQSQSQPSSQQSDPNSKGQQDPNQQGDPNQQDKEQPQDPNQADDPNRQPDPNQSQEPQTQPQTQPVSEQQPESQPAEASGEPPVDERKMSKDEVRRLLQMIRDAEKARREALLRRQRAPRPVERDW